MERLKFGQRGLQELAKRLVRRIEQTYSTRLLILVDASSIEQVSLCWVDLFLMHHVA